MNNLHKLLIKNSATNNPPMRSDYSRPILLTTTHIIKTL